VTRIFAVVLSLIIIFSESAFEHSIVEGILFALGLFLIGIGTIGRLWCSIYISGRKNSMLITVGPYSMTRNPLYLFSFFGAAGVGFATETVTFPIIIIALFALFYPVIIEKEEAYLHEAFGNQYKLYCDIVPRLIPKISLLNEPNEYVVSPSIFRKRMLDSLWFVWIAGILEIIENLHELKIIPVFLLIY
jgi:protein-S-isoprenylcysteine O-methyltransferase Ste14